ncbi:MAG: hypothetical protein ACI4TQ_00540, partial [Alloprevotella sp.]
MLQIYHFAPNACHAPHPFFRRGLRVQGHGCATPQMLEGKMHRCGGRAIDAFFIILRLIFAQPAWYTARLRPKPPLCIYPNFCPVSPPIRSWRRGTNSWLR